ncbi:hypothetical protein [Erwinia phage Snitter]|nr:hypothetical protein [Erwinia phage Snitter]
MMKRRRQTTCTCDAYDFPHRFGGGRCDGIAIVMLYAGSSACFNCHLNNNGCEVIKGQESPKECPHVIEFCHYNEIKL